MLRDKPYRVMFIGLAILAALWMPAAQAGERRGSAFGRSSMSGSGKTTMQLETVSARVARVVVRPGTGGREAWALGVSNARVPGYSTESIGQVVFLKHTPATGWVVVGPPLDARGSPFNPVLSSFSLRGSGEGWAAGDAGTLLYKPADSDVWREDPQSKVVTRQSLNSISLSKDGGYAVGSGPTILRLDGDRWTAASQGEMNEIAAQTNELHSVAAVSANEAWTIATGQVSGVDSTSLLVYRRTSTGWARVTTGRAIFDAPPAKSADGAFNRSAEAGAVAADERGAWVGGRMFPRSPTAPDGDSSPGDSSRAFVIHFDRSGLVTTYCPDQYGDRVSGLDATRTCDQPFPTTPYHVASLSIVPGGDVFAGGLGLFRFSGSGWYREPNANGYLISISMGSNTEGFVASPGRSLGSGGMIRSSSTTIGHWTASPKRSAMARWAQPQSQLLRGLALAEDGSGRALAVGTFGASIIFSGAAWDSIDPGTGLVLNAAAWPAGAEPWAFGGSGTILRLRGMSWELIDSPTTSSLYSAAFRNPAEGVAVGLGGTIIVYKGGRWRDDSPSGIRSDLYSVVATPSGYVAVGSDGAVVEGTPGKWRLRSDARALLKRPDSPTAPALYSATLFGDEIVIGGQDSALLVRRPGGRIVHFEVPLQGTVLSLSGAGDALYASLSPNEEKWRGEAAAAQRGTLMRFANGRWTDIGRERRTTLLRDQVDPSRFEDPIYELRMQSPTAGWGAGGSPADFKDLVEGHFRSRMTSAIYKVAFGENPTQPASSAPLDPEQPGVVFAAFGESWCGTGLCSSAVGTGTMADVVSLQIRDEINKAAKQPGGPEFVLYTGNMRRVGIPEELQQFRNYLKGFDIPVFAAPGTRDRFTGFEVSVPIGARPDSGSHNYWKDVFASQSAPWGNATASRNIEPVGAGNVAPITDAARTHYAFDYKVGGRRVLRVAVIDSSTRSYGTPDQQNPPEDQETWLPSVLAEAQDVLRIPTIVVTNQAPFIPSEQQVPNWSNGGHQQHFEATVAATRVSAVITGGPRVNAFDTIKGVVPLYIVGGGGAPLGRDLEVQEGSVRVDAASKEPSDGYYHAWHLFRLDPADRNPITGQARVTDQAFPIVESLAIHSFAGAKIPAGRTTTITAMARIAAGGFSDPDQAKTQFLEHGTLKFLCGYKGQGEGRCIPDSTVLPRFRFFSEDPSIADFVDRDEVYPTAPRSLGGGFARDSDGSDGLLCVFKLGKVGIHAVAGLHRARIEIEGVPGNGPCVKKEVLGRKIVPPVVTRVPEFVPKAVPEAKQGFSRTLPQQDLAVVFPPPPAPIAAPAPPGAPGVGRKEEHEAEFETESHDEGRHSFTAVSFNQRRRGAAVDRAWMMLGSALALSFICAAMTAAVRERRITSPQIARVRGRR